MGCVDGGPEMHKLRIEFVRPDSRLSWRPLSFQTKRALSANGTKRTYRVALQMSRFRGKADIALRARANLLWLSPQVASSKGPNLNSR